MDRMPQIGRPSFFKVLINDYTSKLSLPHVFVQKYGKFLPENAKIRTSSGETWDVKLEEINDDEKYCFTEGWNKFVEDLELEMFEFLVFWFNTGGSTFNVSVYGIDACEREISAEDRLALDTDADEGFGFKKDCHNVPGKDAELLPKIEAEEENYESGRELSRIKRFQAVIKQYNRCFMDIPKAFALETGIARKEAVNLQNVGEKKWVVKISIIKDGRIRITKGWNEFQAENKLVIGGKYWFEFDATSGNLIMRKECEITSMSSSKRRRGTPPKSIVPPKRGRGRPPKSIIPSKKGRGRPTKSIVLTKRIREVL